LYLILKHRGRLSVFERNMFQGGYLDVNRGSGSSAGWNSIMGSFVISKSTNNLRVMGKKIVRLDDETNMHGRGRYRNFGQKIPKRKPSFGRYLLRQKNTNTIYSREMDLSI